MIQLKCEVCGKTDTAEGYDAAVEAGWCGCPETPEKMLKQFDKEINLRMDICPKCKNKKGFNMDALFNKKMQEEIIAYNKRQMNRLIVAGGKPSDILSDIFGDTPEHSVHDIEFRE